MNAHSIFPFVCSLSKRSFESLSGKCSLIITGCIISLFVFAMVPSASAQQVLFDFDSAPLYTSLPIYQTAGGITAHLSATGSGYSVQAANVLGFTPPGFAGRILYPNSIYGSDIQVHFDQTLTDFSIMYCVQELGCDNSATMRVTAYMSGTFVGYSNRTATFPGTWPVDTLKCHYPQGFDSVVVHYQSPPPTCQDYGVVYLADNMRVTQIPVGIIPESGLPEVFSLEQNYPNPFNPSTKIKFALMKDAFTKISVYDELGREAAVLVNEELKAGSYETNWNAENFPSGVYFYKIESGDYTASKKMILIK